MGRPWHGPNGMQYVVPEQLLWYSQVLGMIPVDAVNQVLDSDDHDAESVPDFDTFDDDSVPALVSDSPTIIFDFEAVTYNADEDLTPTIPLDDFGVPRSHLDWPPLDDIHPALLNLSEMYFASLMPNGPIQPSEDIDA